ncbi:MAG: antibiotic biosynthesis monooxygenase [Chloroflexi bacterium]|nr:antibiotic biosynthesis monooxygenase [Chloroflexota bacterium]MCL5951449.1 antibiotic biosynthesis monooxygenase [Chloroflexota bacterium]
MVLHVIKWDVHPDKTEAFQKWSEGAIRRKLAVPGIVEFRAYRGVAGAPQVVVTHEFADMAAWAAWNFSDEVQKIQAELRTFTVNVTSELWGPLPSVPAPMRPGKQVRE